MYTYLLNLVISLANLSCVCLIIRLARRTLRVEESLLGLDSINCTPEITREGARGEGRGRKRRKRRSSCYFSLAFNLAKTFVLGWMYHLGGVSL